MRSFSMMFCLLLAMTSPAFGASNTGATQDAQALRIQSVTVRETTPDAEAIAKVRALYATPRLAPVADGLTGAPIWDIIVDNRPTIHTESHQASALPPSVQDWSRMMNWQGPMMKSYVIEARNFLGLKVVSIDYVVSGYYGGNLDGKGAYLANVTILPLKVWVAFGYSLNSRVEAGAPINVASQDAPVAGLPLDLVYSIGTILSRTEYRLMYFVTGDGQVQPRQVSR